MFHWVSFLSVLFFYTFSNYSYKSYIIKYQSGIELMTIDTSYQVIESSTLRSSSSRPTLVPLQNLTAFVWRWSTAHQLLINRNRKSEWQYFLSSPKSVFIPPPILTPSQQKNFLARSFWCVFDCLRGFLFNFLSLPPQQTNKTIVFLFLCLAPNPRNSKITCSEKQQKWFFINCKA